MRVLVTGALGHIGSKLIRDPRLIELSDEIIMLDNFLVQRYCSLFNLPLNKKYRFIEGDIYQSNLENLFRGVDVVIHLAAITDAAGSFKNTSEIEVVNLKGTTRVAEACAHSGSKLINLSTTSVYGTQENIVDENCSDEELKPQSPYAKSKLEAEKLIKRISSKLGLDFVTCRFGTIFGVSPGMRFHTAVNKFCWQAVMKSPITVWRTAINQYRPYLDLNDAINAIIFIIENDIFDNEIYNILTINATVGEITNCIESFIPIEIELVDNQIMNQLSYHVKNNKFMEKGFKNNGDLRQGIENTIKLLQGANSYEQRN